MVKRLGRGFDSLLPDNFDNSILQDDRNRIQKLLISDILPNKDQPRKEFDSDALDQLAKSIATHGILQPVIVRAHQDGRYLLVAGERRWRAAKLAGLDHVPAIVRTLEELAELEIALVENVQRVDLSPLEQAASIQRLHEQFSKSLEDIAMSLGKAVPTVHNIVRLLQLPTEASKALRQAAITEGHARAILALRGDEKAQSSLLKNIIDKKWSVRQAEQYATQIRAGDQTKLATKKASTTSNKETKLLEKKLGTSVAIKRTAKGGAILIHFKSDTELHRLLKQF